MGYDDNKSQPELTFNRVILLSTVVTILSRLIFKRISGKCIFEDILWGMHLVLLYSYTITTGNCISLWPIWVLQINLPLGFIYVNIFLNALHLKGICGPKEPTKLFINLLKITKRKNVYINWYLWKFSHIFFLHKIKSHSFFKPPCTVILEAAMAAVVSHTLSALII